MTGVITKKLDIDIAKRFIDDVESSNNNYYIFVGRSYPWSNDSSPPEANLAVTFYDHEAYDNILYGKKVTNNDIIQSIRRVNWTNNTLYYEYDKDNSDLYSNNYNFYVYNTSASVKSVFKVIEAGSGNSVVAPAIITTSPFKTSDGYVWKYMYTVSDPDMSKFGSINFIPLTPNTVVTSAATPGSIDAIKVVTEGSDWVTFNTGFLQSVVNATAVIISSDGSSNNDFYVNSSIYFKSGLGSGQIRRVIDYDGASKVVYVDEPLDIKTNFTLANVVGSFAINDTVTQNLVSLNITSQFGYIQPGDVITQNITEATGTVVTANSTIFRVKPLSGDNFESNFAIDAGRGTILGFNSVTTSNTSNTVAAAINTRTFNASTGVAANGRIAISTNPFAVNDRVTYTVSAGNTAVVGLANGSSYFVEFSNSSHIYLAATPGGTRITLTPGLSQTGHTFTSNAAFISFYPQGSYIKVGTHFHRVVTVANNNSLNVAGPFGATYTSNIHYELISAATVSSCTNISASGNIVYSDLNGSTVSISNTTGNYSLGEIVSQSSSSTNGVVAFTNSSTIIISSITGPGFVTNNPIVGLASNSSANVTSVASTPTITLTDVTGGFIYGTEITSTSGGSAKISSTTLLPNEQTQYIISPRVTIEGDGVGAAAYSMVNTSTTGISSIVVFDTGRNYTTANAVVSANPNYGSGAVLKPLVSPVLGHGGDAGFELGASYASIYTAFANSLNESYNIPGYGQFRTVGLIKNPLFDNVFLTVNNFNRSKITLTGANTFTVGNVLQQANLATGTVVYSNTSHVELRDVNGTFDKTNANVTIRDIITGMTSTISNVVTSVFAPPGTLLQQNTGATGEIVTANTTTVRLANVQGIFRDGEIVYQTTSNAYANVTDVNTANNLKTLTFDYFNQLTRASLSLVTGNFVVNEMIQVRTPIQSVIASARVYNVNNEIDLVMSGNSVPFTLFERINFGSSANGILIGANSTYLKLTNVKGTFLSSTTVTGSSSGASASVSNVIRVLTLADLDGTFAESVDNVLVGLTSNAQGYVGNPNTIVRPMLVRDTGSVLYIENTETPVTRTDTSRESVNLVIKF